MFFTCDMQIDMGTVMAKPALAAAGGLTLSAHGSAHNPAGGAASVNPLANAHPPVPLHQASQAPPAHATSADSPPVEASPPAPLHAIGVPSGSFISGIAPASVFSKSAPQVGTQVNPPAAGHADDILTSADHDKVW